MIGQVVGNYKVVEKIGEGGMGAVYRGIDLMLEREVAVKALRPELASQPQVVERFRSEAVTLAKLNHPNVATLYSFFRQGNDYFMVLEFVRGQTLDHVIGENRAMTCEQAIPLFCQVLEGIDHAHRFGVIHRDIKPANMMLTEAGTLKVLDFGIARVLGTARMTKVGHLIGTIEYMSPEQVRGQETDARSDIYSLGLLLYEMLTGRIPFQSNSEFDLMKSQVDEIPPPPRTFAPHVPETVEAAILRALEKRPDARFQTAGEFRAALLAAGVAPAAVYGDPAATRGFNAPPPSNPQFITTPLTQPPVSQPGVAPPISTTNSKETRLSGDVAGNFDTAAATPAPPAAEAAKETRLAMPGYGLRPEGDGGRAQPPPTGSANAHAATPTPQAHAGQWSPAPAALAAPQQAKKGALPFFLNVKILAAAAGAVLLLLVAGGVGLALFLRSRTTTTQETTKTSTVAPAAATPEATPTPAAPAPPAGMVYVPGGEFSMGRDDGDEYERPSHLVTVKPFFIDTYEVTNDEYAKFVAEKSYTPPPTWKNGAYPEGAARRPVTGVTWEDASAYASWAGKRLPTEEEWEFAARGTDRRLYPWGNEWQTGYANADKVNKGMTDVGSSQGRSPYGAYDMVGNAWEWTATAMAPYPGATLPEDAATGDSLKVIRGGFWNSARARATTTFRRGWPATGGEDYSNTSFRCAMDAGGN